MWEGRSRDEWERAALLAAVTANANRGPNDPALGPDDFNPWARMDRDAAAESPDQSERAFSFLESGE